MERNERGIENAWKEKDDQVSISTFFDNTSLHGARFLNEKNVFKRLAWFVFLATAFGFCSYQIYDTLNLFYERPFSTAISKERKRELDFPAVTICNLNFISKRQFIKSFRATHQSNKTDEDLEYDIQMILAAMLSTNDQAKTNPELTKRKQELDAGMFRARGHWMMQSLSNYSHKIEDMLGLDWLDPCIWRGKKCSAENFTSFVSLEKGQCYTFNSGREGHPRLKTSIPGSTYGLKLRLNVEEQDHVSNSFSLESGFKVTVQHQKELPQISQFGFAVQPGTHTYVSLQPKMIENLKDPYETNCRSPELNITKALNYSYSVFSCMTECAIKYVVESCGCQPLHKIFPDEEICSIGETFGCVYPILFGPQPEKVIDCSKACPEPCEYYKYDTHLSYASAISNAFSRNVPKNLAAKAKPGQLAEFKDMSYIERIAFLRDNVVAIDIYFEEIAYDVIAQKEALSRTSVFGTIGGYLGLFLGMSVLTILEFVDFVIHFIFKKCVTNNQQTRVQHQS